MLLKHGSKLAKKKLLPKDYSRQPSEHAVHLHAWQWVQEAYPNLLIFHVPSGEHRNIVTAMKLKRMGVVPGVADFLMFIPGCSIAIELKDESGKQSGSQKIFQKKWETCGNRYRIARSLKEFQDVVEFYASPWLHNQEP